MPDVPLTTGQLATLACQLEVTAPKPGNVHRGADFADLCLTDFLVSATCLGPPMDAAARTGVGACVLQSIQSTQRATGRNTNLGTVLLLAPLAAVPRSQPLAAGIEQVLSGLTEDDSRQVYEAIRLARPGGMGRVERMDVQGPAPPRLLEAMQAASQRDLVARQYVEGFALVLGNVSDWLVEDRRASGSLTEAIIRTQLRILAEHPDSLIARKGGEDLARQASLRATAALAAGFPGDPAYYAALSDLDFWMRSDGNRRNPGTTADLIAAGLFAALREGRLLPPYR